ncbi:MAG: hypothetical protein SFW09_23945 [Hyphomicrobiaceae bacterium]|nr:hypothetical protein [Hyphomicrobiaceae bacterium]
MVERGDGGLGQRVDYERGLGIMQTLARLAPDHAAFKRDLAWFEARLAEMK